MAKINVAIIGCGFVAYDHFSAWQRIPQATVSAICDMNEKALKRAAEDWKIPRVYTSTSEMIDCKDINLWDICTPPHTHASLAVQAMKEGFNVLIEKPMTMTLKDAEEIVGCQKTTGMKAGVIHNWLFEPPVVKAKNIIEKGNIGEIISAEVATIHTESDPMASNQNYWCHKMLGGRFSEVLAHPIYLLRYFLGEITVNSVSVSKIGKHPWMKSDELNATFEAEGKLGRTYISFNAPRESIFISVYGRQAILKVDMINATVLVLTKRERSKLGKGVDSLRQAAKLSTSTIKNALKILSRRWISGHEMCMRLFAESLINEEEPPVTVQEGYEVIRVLEDMCTMIEAAENKRARM